MPLTLIELMIEIHRKCFLGNLVKYHFLFVLGQEIFGAYVCQWRDDQSVFLQVLFLKYKLSTEHFPNIRHYGKINKEIRELSVSS